MIKSKVQSQIWHYLLILRVLCNQLINRLGEAQKAVLKSNWRISMLSLSFRSVIKSVCTCAAQLITIYDFQEKPIVTLPISNMMIGNKPYSNVMHINVEQMCSAYKFICSLKGHPVKAKTSSIRNS